MNKIIARVLALTLLLIGGLVMAEPTSQGQDGADQKFVQWGVSFWPEKTAVQKIEPFNWYHMSNDHEQGDFLEYGERTWGINLVWGSGKRHGFIWFDNCTRPGHPIYGSDLVAIRVQTGGYLVHGSRNVGPDLTWYWPADNRLPGFSELRENACQWRLVSKRGSSFGPTNPHDFAIYNVKRRGYLFYQKRTLGINLGWDSEPAPSSREARADLVPEALEILGSTAVYLSIANRGNVPIKLGSISNNEIGVRIGNDNISLVMGETLGPGKTLRKPIRSSGIPEEICGETPVTVDTRRLYQGGKGVFDNDTRTLTLTDFHGEIDCNDGTTYFQQGRLPKFGYSGANDVTLTQALPDLTVDDPGTCLVDGDDPPNSGNDHITLLRWWIGDIPKNSRVTGATIKVNVTNASDDKYSVYAANRNWQDDQATWKAYSKDAEWSTEGASGNTDRGAKVGTLQESGEGWAGIHLNEAGKAMIQSWIENPSSNHGVIVANTDATDGVDFSCSETSASGKRPVLTVDYVEAGKNRKSDNNNGRDVTISQALPEQRLGDPGTCVVDGDDPSGSKNDLVTLLRWYVGHLPKGTKVKAASITLNATNPSKQEYPVYAAKRNWRGKQATWNENRQGSSWLRQGASGSQDRGPQVGTLKAGTEGKAVIKLNNAGIQMVQSWIDTPSENHGVIIANSEAGDGIDFSCSEAPFEWRRPLLKIEHSQP